MGGRYSGSFGLVGTWADSMLGYRAAWNQLIFPKTGIGLFSMSVLPHKENTMDYCIVLAN